MMKTLPLHLTDVTKDDLTRLFKKLRQAGFFARQSYWCCNSCGCAALESDMKPEQEKWVFYHKQDADAFFPPEWGATRRNLYLTFGGLSGKARETEKIGREIVRIAESCGLTVDWNGKWTTRIAILPQRIAGLKV